MGLVVTFSSCKKEETPEETIDNFVVANGKDNACTIIYAYGSDGKHRTRRTYAENMATFIFQQCGVKPAVEDDREAEGDGYEILLGDTNRAATATVKAEITGTLTYIVRAVDKKLVIVAGSDLALSEAVSTFINTTKQLNYKVSKKDNAMSFKNGYNYTITLPAAVTNVKDLGYIATALEATITKDNNNTSILWYRAAPLTVSISTRALKTRKQTAVTTSITIIRKIIRLLSSKSKLQP